MSELTKLNPSIGQAMESVLIDGDLSKFTSEQRVVYYKKVCDSVGLNPLTRPFEYQKYNGKLQLYARKEATEQLRSIYTISIYKIETNTTNDVFMVTAYARNAAGKEDVSTGAVSISGLKGEALANAHMKAETKAKRRVTLSICGLGMLDETEINTFPNSFAVHIDHATGEILQEEKQLKIGKTDEDILNAISAERLNQLAEEISTAKNIDELKSSYGRAYVIHQGREDLMPRLKDLKDMRKKQLETAAVGLDKAFFDEYCPALGDA